MDKDYEIINEVCYCGHMKMCHNPHKLDVNGGDCSHCECDIYTWREFIFRKIKIKSKSSDRRISSKTNAIVSKTDLLNSTEDTLKSKRK